MYGSQKVLKCSSNANMLPGTMVEFSPRLLVITWAIPRRSINLKFLPVPTTFCTNKVHLGGTALNAGLHKHWK